MLAIFLDIETTGLDPNKHCAIDIALKIVDVSTFEIKGSFQAIVKQSAEAWQKRDPVSIQINGYTWEEVVNGVESSLVSSAIIKLFGEQGIERGKAVFICQNPAFDRGFFGQLIDVYTQEKLHWPYHWLDLASMYWTRLSLNNSQQKIAFPEKMNLSKNAIAQQYGLPPELEPHKAVNGVDHLILCYKAVLKTHLT